MSGKGTFSNEHVLMKMLSLRKGGMGLAQLSEMFGVDKSAITYWTNKNYLLMRELEPLQPDKIEWYDSEYVKPGSRFKKPKTYHDYLIEQQVKDNLNKDFLLQMRRV